MFIDLGKIKTKEDLKRLLRSEVKRSLTDAVKYFTYKYVDNVKDVLRRACSPNLYDVDKIPTVKYLLSLARQFDYVIEKERTIFVRKENISGFDGEVWVYEFKLCNFKKRKNKLYIRVILWIRITESEDVFKPYKKVRWGHVLLKDILID